MQTDCRHVAVDLRRVQQGTRLNRLCSCMKACRNYHLSQFVKEIRFPVSKITCEDLHFSLTYNLFLILSLIACNCQLESGLLIFYWCLNEPKSHWKHRPTSARRPARKWPWNVWFIAVTVPLVILQSVVFTGGTLAFGGTLDKITIAAFQCAGHNHGFLHIFKEKCMSMIKFKVIKCFIFTLEVFYFEMITFYICSYLILMPF